MSEGAISEERSECEYLRVRVEEGARCGFVNGGQHLAEATPAAHYIYTLLSTHITLSVCITGLRHCCSAQVHARIITQVDSRFTICTLIPKWVGEGEGMTGKGRTALFR